MDYQNVFISSTILLRAGVQAGELLRPMRTVVINSAYGTLELGVNDIDTSNNRGSFTVEVSICRAR
jgi:hypothetical protein